MTKVKKLTLENYKAIKGRQELDMEGASFLIVGPNNKGKTTIGRAVMDAISKTFPTKPVTEGEKEGFIEVKLDDGREIYVKLEEGKKPKVTLITTEGYKIDATKPILDKLSGAGSSFDIDAFLQMAPKPRREMVEQLLGVDLSDLNAKESDWMEKAADNRRAIKLQMGKIDETIDESYAQKDEVKVSELAAELEKKKQLRADQEARVVQHNNIENEADEITNEIERLEERLTAKRQEIARIDVLIQEARKDLPTTTEIEEIRVKMQTAEETNAKISKAKTNQLEKEALLELEDALEEAEKQVQKYRAEKENRLAENPMPADGLKFTPDGELLIDGLPFESDQISTSRKIIAGIQLKAAMLGEVRFIHFDASALDKKNADEIVEWAEKQDLQICVERPIWDGEDEIKFEYYTKDEK